jgi:hypothetical protein
LMLRDSAKLALVRRVSEQIEHLPASPGLRALACALSSHQAVRPLEQTQRAPLGRYLPGLLAGAPADPLSNPKSRRPTALPIAVRLGSARSTINLQTSRIDDFGNVDDGAFEQGASRRRTALGHARSRPDRRSPSRYAFRRRC